MVRVFQDAVAYRLIDEWTAWWQRWQSQITSSGLV